MTTTDEPVTFRELAYALFDVDENAVRTTQWGNLAIFSVKAVAEQYAAKSVRKTIVIPVRIWRTDK